MRIKKPTKQEWTVWTDEAMAREVDPALKLALHRLLERNPEITEKKQ